MRINETTAKSLLRKHKRIDSWFVSRYSMNLYRGCSHNCAYCDGRAEGYYVPGEFGRDVEVKTNAPDLLQRELDPKRRRKPLKRAYVMLGGGVGDAYQEVEETYGLARRALAAIEEFDWPVHVLTKSCRVERDLDLILRINQKQRAIVSMSFSTVDDAVAKRFEPMCSLPSERLHTLRQFKAAGIATGMFLMPVIPFVTDDLQSLDAALRAADESGIDFVIFGAMTLKAGRQQDHFLKAVDRYNPGLKPEYAMLYGDNRWGSPNKEYHEALSRAFVQVASKHRVPRRVPPNLYADILDDNDNVQVMLEHLDYFHRERGQTTPYRYAANSVAKLKEPLTDLKSLRQLNGVGPATERLIKEILQTGKCKLLESFL